MRRFDINDLLDIADPATGQGQYSTAVAPDRWHVIKQFRWQQPAPIAFSAIVAIGIVYTLTNLPGWWVGLIVALLALLFLARWVINGLRFIDQRIWSTLGATGDWPVHTKTYALYKFADIHHAASTIAEATGRSILVASAHNMPLEIILSGLNGAVRRISAPMLVPRKVAYEEDEFFPSDSFWLVRGQADMPPCIVRVRLPFRTNLCVLEVAAPSATDALHLIEQIGTWAGQHSVYRGNMIRVVFAPEVRGEYDEDESVDGMDLLFYKPQLIADADIVLDESQRAVVERTIIDFHQRREQLAELGLPRKRGVLFYGPPGTGKTYTCKYIANRLAHVTTVVATGHALLNMKAVCAVARSLQPALVLLEDVDLVFSNREINNYNTVLGEFIDQLDGFGETDEIIFILTTNAIDRIEAAIKDRPGRVSQCIFFGPPTSALRQRYLESLLRPYETSAVDFERIVAQTDQVSQAFLKELVFRGVQLASARLNGGAHMPLPLTTDDITTALRDMTIGSGRAAQRIIGFRVDS